MSKIKWNHSQVGISGSNGTKSGTWESIFRRCERFDSCSKSPSRESLYIKENSPLSSSRFSSLVPKSPKLSRPLSHLSLKRTLSLMDKSPLRSHSSAFSSRLLLLFFSSFRASSSSSSSVVVSHRNCRWYAFSFVKLGSSADSSIVDLDLNHGEE